MKTIWKYLMNQDHCKEARWHLLYVLVGFITAQVMRHGFDFNISNSIDAIFAHGASAMIALSWFLFLLPHWIFCIVMCQRKKKRQRMARATEWPSPRKGGR